MHIGRHQYKTSNITPGRCGVTVERISPGHARLCGQVESAPTHNVGFDAADPLNIGYNDGWNDAIKQAAKIVNDARWNGRDLYEIRDELKGLIQKKDGNQ